MSPTEPWRLRRATRADVAQLLQMMRAFNRAEGIPFRSSQVAPALGRLLRERRLGEVVVAETGVGRQLAGYAIATFGYDLEFAGPDGYVTDLFVRPRHRRGGLGARLLEAVTGAVRDAGAKAAHLMVWPHNQVARRLYARAGFEEIPRVMMTRRLEPRPGVKASGRALARRTRASAADEGC